MMKRRFTEHQIISILKEADSGIPIAELTRKYGLGNSTIYHWRAKYGGLRSEGAKALES